MSDQLKTRPAPIIPESETEDESTPESVPVDGETPKDEVSIKEVIEDLKKAKKTFQAEQLSISGTCSNLQGLI